MSAETRTARTSYALLAAWAGIVAGAAFGAAGHALLSDPSEVAMVRSMGDGTHAIGSLEAPHDTWIAPGGPECAWAAYAGVDDGQPTSRGGGTGRQSVNLEGEEQVFRTARCGTWTSARSTPAPTTRREATR